MQLTLTDWLILGLFFAISLGIGIYASRSAGKSAASFFLSGRNMPWWLLGVSMVATTFSCDTPNLVADIVRKQGVAGNWVWWAFLLTGTLTVFIYARLWRRAGLFTDLGFYELRYSGKMAAFLRIFRAVYLGLVFNIIIMATVCLAMIKIGGVMLGWSPEQTLLITLSITAVYSAIGGFKGILLTDFFQFFLSLLGAVLAAWWLLDLPEIGGLQQLLAHPNVSEKLPLFPDFSDPSIWVPLFLLPLAVQWWSVWYPGSEPGGGGYVAQRMLSARNEAGAVKATLFFNLAHYAIRPWPWILVALASLVIFPDVAALQTAFPNIATNLVNDDLAYPAMLSLLPEGLAGLLLASLTAAFMSTISTQTNWGASYLVADVYKRAINPEATDKQQVQAGRIVSVVLILLAALLAPLLQSALSGFSILLQIGAGTGLIFILRWFWWRINAWTELSGMAISFAIAIFFELVWPQIAGSEAAFSTTEKLLWGTGLTTLGWLLVTLLTKPEPRTTLYRFCKKTQPGGPGWQKVTTELKAQGEKVTANWQVPEGVAAMVAASIFIYSLLFGTGMFLYRDWLWLGIWLLVALAAGGVLRYLWGRLSIE